MNAEKRKRLEAAGWKVGTLQEFLGASDAHMELIEFYRTLAEAVVARRKKLRLTEAAAAERCELTLKRYRAVELGLPPATLDAMFLSYALLDGRIKDLFRSRPAAKSK